MPIYLRDVARVTVGTLPQTGIFAVNEQTTAAGGGVEGIVLMRRWENPSEVLQRIHEAVEDINATRLPRGVRLVPIHDRTELVQKTLRTVSRVLLEGFVVVVTVLFLFLVSVRAALLTALIIPLSLLFALVCMHVTGVSLNLLSIGALDFGVIVDGTIVMVERIMHTLEARRELRGNVSAIEAIRAAALDVQRPILFSLLIIIAAYIPLLTLERVERRLFTPMALTVVYALLGSLVLALTLVPAVASWLFRAGETARKHVLLDWINAGYERVIRVTVHQAGWTAVLASSLVLGALYLGTRLGSEFLPQLDEGVIWIRAS